MRGSLLTVHHVPESGTETNMAQMPAFPKTAEPDEGGEPVPRPARDDRFVGAFDPKSPRLRLIAGDASDRKFFRYREGDSTYICMQFPSWSGGYGGAPLSWLGMHRALQAWQLPVPEVVHVDEEHACIWTTDLGDTFLNRDLGSEPLDARRPEHRLTAERYREAVSLLIRAQYPKDRPHLQHPARTRAFDEDKLLFELNFFGEHFLEGLLSQPISRPLQAEWHDLSQEISRFERVLCHRDYHARNLMIAGGKVHWIDFQDARMGPHSYDLVSLLRDSYVRFEPGTRESLFDQYLEELNRERSGLGLSLITPERFYRERLLVGLQRNIKALGSFAYLFRVKRKKVYLSFVSHTLSIILSESLASELTVRFPATLHLVEDLVAGQTGKTFRALIQKEAIDQF